jgi:vitamin B12 transporter
MKNYLISTIVLFSTIVLSAQIDTVKSELSEITVSANKLETSLFQTASSVSIITTEQISIRQSSSVVDLLKDVPGISISQQGGTGKLSSVFMRGANSNFVLVMIDNVEVNDPSSSNNGYDFSSLQVSDIERIEVVRGPQSTLYGSEATAGIINILTKSGKGKPSYTALAEGGSNSYYKGSISAKGETLGLNYLVNFSRLQTDAVSSIKGIDFETDGYLNNSGFLKLGYSINENLGINLSYKYVDTETDLDQAEKNGDDPNFDSDLESHLLNLKLDGVFMDGAWETSFRGSYYGNQIKALDEFDDSHPATSSKSNYKGNRLSFNWQNNVRLIDNNLITVGIDHKKDEARSTYHSEGLWGPFDSNFPEESISTTGVYIQDFINYKNFSSTVGFRYDNNEKFGSVSTYRIAPMYFVETTGTKIKGTYGTGFNAPSLFNLFAPFYGNSDLKPEISKGWDLGFDQFLLNNKISIGLTYFDMNFEDMLGFDENFRSININKAETSGIEVILNIQNIYGFSLNANYTHNETFDVSKNTTSEEQLIRRPKKQLSINLSYDYKKLNLGLSVNHSGEKFDTDFSTFPIARVSLDSYTLVNLTSSYSITEYLRLFGRFENLLDEDYEDILYYGNLGRSGYLGLELNL